MDYMLLQYQLTTNWAQHAILFERFSPGKRIQNADGIMNNSERARPNDGESCAV